MAPSFADFLGYLVTRMASEYFSIDFIEFIINPFAEQECVYVPAALKYFHSFVDDACDEEFDAFVKEIADKPHEIIEMAAEYGVRAPDYVYTMIDEEDGFDTEGSVSFESFIEWLELADVNECSDYDDFMEHFVKPFKAIQHA